MNRSRLPHAVTAVVLLFFYLPIAVLVLNSFNASRTGTVWSGWSLKWYARLFHQREAWHALLNSLTVAGTATLVSMVFGTTAAFALHRYGRSRLQRVHLPLLFTPIVVPDILMGMSLLMLFVSAQVPLGLFTIFLAHVTFCISFVALVVLGRLQDFDEHIVEAAYDLGASRAQAFLRVVLPLLAPGIVAGGLLAFTLSLDDFVITFFVHGPGSTTLPIYIYSIIKHGATPLINALSSILLTVTFVLVLVSRVLTRESQGL